MSFHSQLKEKIKYYNEYWAKRAKTPEELEINIRSQVYSWIKRFYPERFEEETGIKLDYVKSIDKLPKEHPFYGREKEFVKLMNDDLTKDIESKRVEWEKDDNY